MSSLVSVTESHGKLVEVRAGGKFTFHLVFSNKTESDQYCLEIWHKLNDLQVEVSSACSFAWPSRTS